MRPSPVYFPGKLPTAVLTLVLALNVCPLQAIKGATTDRAHETLLERAFALDEGASVPRDAAAAAKLYREAAAQGDPYAHLRLGYLTEIGDGVSQDYAVARGHYEAATDAGLAEARVRLAICHLEGWGGPVDRAAFVREMQAAAEAGNLTAQHILATVYFIGLGVPKNREEGLRWLERAAAQDDPESQYRIGRHVEITTRMSRLPGVPLARTWFQLAAEQEYQNAMRAMARTFLAGAREDRNWELGYQWLKLASEGGDAESPFILAVSELLHRDIPQRNFDQARVWLQLASKRGNSRASEVLQLELAGRPLAEAARFVLTEPFDERYIQRAATMLSDAPTRPPVVYRMVRPVYPQSLRMTNTTGEVIVDFFVEPTGQVTNATIVKTPHPLFGDRALEAVNQWRFHPGRKDGRLVRTHMQVPVIFELGSGEQLDGVDATLREAASRASRLGEAVASDARELRMAKPAKPLRRPRQADGSPLPPDVRAMVLLVLDETGRPVRGHVLKAEPSEAGSSLLASGLEGTFIPRLINGEAVPSNVVLVYRTGHFRTGIPIK